MGLGAEGLRHCLGNMPDTTCALQEVLQVWPELRLANALPTSAAAAAQPRSDAASPAAIATVHLTGTAETEPLDIPKPVF